MPVIFINDITGRGPDIFASRTDAQLRSRQRPGEGLFITEGPKVTWTALEKGYAPVAVLMRSKMINGVGREILRRCEDVPVYTADDDTLAALTGFRLQRAWVLCAFRRQPPRTDVQALENARRIAVLEGITEPSNVGAIFRSAAALGVDALLLTPDCCDPMHRRALRVCMGAVLTVPWAYTQPDHGFQALKERNFFTVGMALEARSLPLDAPEFCGHEKLALYLGTEDTGLCDATLKGCDALAVIPMARGIDSLNVAAAAAIAFWQLRPRDRL